MGLRDEHFTVDGSLLEAWASAKSFQPKNKKSSYPPDDRRKNPTVNYRGEKRSNETHESRSDPDSADWRERAKGKEAKLSYSGNLLVENRNGLIVTDGCGKATGTAEALCGAGNAAGIPGSTARDGGWATRVLTRRISCVSAWNI